jgi:hypothetical protein
MIVPSHGASGSCAGTVSTCLGFEPGSVRCLPYSDLRKEVLSLHEFRHFPEYGLVVVTYREPFSVSDLMSVAETLAIPGQGKDQHRALLIDLRQVAVTGVSGSDSWKFIAVRKTRMPGIPAEPAAFLIRWDPDSGNIRMHNLWSEALGLRKEEDTLVTTDLNAGCCQTNANQSPLPQPRRTIRQRKGRTIRRERRLASASALQ